MNVKWIPLSSDAQVKAAATTALCPHCQPQEERGEKSVLVRSDDHDGRAWLLLPVPCGHLSLVTLCFLPSSASLFASLGTEPGTSTCWDVLHH